MPGENIYDWSITAASNGTADSAINWAEGQARASVNDSARSMMAAHAKNRNLQNGSITTAGTANAQTFSSGYGFIATNIPVGLRVTLKIGAGLTNTGATTLNVDGTGAVAVKYLGGDLGGGELLAGSYSHFLWDGTNWILLDRSPRQSIAALTSAYSVLAGDFGKIFTCSGSFTLSHTVTAANAGAGFTYTIKNTGNATVTIDPAGSETIDGAATLYCLAKQEFQVVCDGTNWITVGRQNVVRISHADYSGNSISIILPPNYISFELLANSFSFVGASEQLGLTFANDGVPTFITSANYFPSHLVGTPPSTAAFVVGAASAYGAVSHVLLADAPSDAWLRIIPYGYPSWQYKSAAFYNASAHRGIVEGGGILWGLGSARPTHVRLHGVIGASNFSGGSFTLIGTAP